MVGIGFAWKVASACIVGGGEQAPPHGLELSVGRCL